MPSPGYGTQVLVQSGNVVSATAPPGPPVFDNRVFMNLGSPIGAPSFAPPTMPKIERITPRSTNAGLTIRNRAAQVRVKLRSSRDAVYQTMRGYAASAQDRGLDINRIKRATTTTTATRIK